MRPRMTEQREFRWALPDLHIVGGWATLRPHGWRFHVFDIQVAFATIIESTRRAAIRFLPLEAL